MNRSGTLPWLGMLAPWLLIIIPLAGPGSLAVVMVCCAAISAYRGGHPVVYQIIAVLLIIELIYGFDAGVYSLGYAVAALTLRAAERFMSVQAWSQADGWNLWDFTRTLLTALAFYSVSVAASLLIGHFVFGYSQIIARAQVLLGGSMPLLAVLTASITLAILRRCDVPFRRRISFGI